MSSTNIFEEDLRMRCKPEDIKLIPLAERLEILFSGMSAESIAIVRASSLFKICEKTLEM